jgi:broad specificity phosphatase PhoE
MDLPASQAIRTRLLLLCRGPLDWSQAEDGDPPLTPEGVLDAELVAAALPHIDAIAASTQRAGQDTAEAILAQRTVAVDWRAALDEIRSAAPLTDEDAYTGWLDQVCAVSASFGEGESLADGAERMTAALRAIADRYHGRATLVVSHPVVLLAFRGAVRQTEVQRDQIDALPPLALSILDYVAGRFYLVQDFPMRHRLS